MKQPSPVTGQLLMRDVMDRAQWMALGRAAGIDDVAITDALDGLQDDGDEVDPCVTALVAFVMDAVFPMLALRMALANGAGLVPMANAGGTVAIGIDDGLLRAVLAEFLADGPRATDVLWAVQAEPSLSTPTRGRRSTDASAFTLTPDRVT